MGKRVHVIPHTHWDREWYFTTSRSKIYLMLDFKEVLDTMETDKEFKFMLDAQASLLDDYLKWSPKDKERIEKFVKEKRLVIGPWYTQTDQMVISAESIVRNMYYGMKRCKDFGGYMNVAYVPDSFGQAGNMPQIYQAFGIKDTLFWRGVSDDMVKNTDFIWEGDDGSQVFTTQIPFGYYIGGNIPETEEEAKKFWESRLYKAGRRSSTDSIYFPNGFDQYPIQKNLSELIENRRKQDPENEYFISTIEEYMDDVKRQKPKLDKVKGELLIAKHMRIHKSIYSSRSDLKMLNTQIQNYVTNVMEPILVISAQMGNEYPKETVADIWKLLFENAAHDSIGSCIFDSANEDVYTRYKQARDIALNLVELHCRLIATSIKNNHDTISWTLFNTLPFVRNDVIEFKTYIPDGEFSIVDAKGNDVPYTVIEKKDMTEYILAQTIRLDPSKEIYIPNKVYEAVIAIYKKDMPAMGYEQCNLVLGRTSEVATRDLNCLENEYYKIDINEKGYINILDKKNGTLYEKQAILMESGDDGDSFNYSPLRKDMKIYSSDFTPEVHVFGSDIIQKASLKYKMIVPHDLKDRESGIANSELPVELILTLSKNSEVIGVKVKVDNKVLSHRLCILFDAEMATKFNIADEQFGSIKRENVHEKEMQLYLDSFKNAKKEVFNPLEPEYWHQNEDSWQEPPISIEPCQSYVTLSNEDRTIGVIPQGVREYEIIGENKNIICLTLFRSYGTMGKANLLYRPGRASGERTIATPDAQLLKEMEFNCGVVYSDKDFNNSKIELLAKKFNTGIEVYEYTKFLNGRLIFYRPEIIGTEKDNLSLFETGNNLVVSAIKNAEDMPGIIIRLYNGKNHLNQNETIKFHKDIKNAMYVDLKEEKISDIEAVDNTININDLGHCKFVSIYVEFAE